MDAKTYWRLSIMMFLQFFVWGSWFVTLGTHLGDIGFTGSQIGYAFLMNNIAAIISPFFIGMIADRYFASQKVMGMLHLLGAVIMYFSADVTAVGMLIFGLLLYNLTYMPTLALVNAVSFNQMKSPDAEFPKVRVWGTLGWIAAGLVISFVLSEYYPDVEKTSSADEDGGDCFHPDGALLFHAAQHAAAKCRKEGHAPVKFLESKRSDCSRKEPSLFSCSVRCSSRYRWPSTTISPTRS